MDKSLGKKMHDYFYNLGAKSRAPIQNTLTEAKKIAGEFKDTVSDIPAIAKTQAITAWPKILDAGNDYLYKPVTRNVKAFVTGKDTTGPNALDKVADDARAYEDNFYKNHDFNQDANHQYGKALGNALEAGATLPATALKAPKVVAWVKTLVTGGKTVAPTAKVVTSTSKAVNTAMKTKEPAKSLTQQAKEALPAIINKDKQVIKQQQKIKELSKKLTKDKKKMTDEQILKVQQYIEGLKEQLKVTKKNIGIKKWLEMRKSAKLDKEIAKIANPDGKVVGWMKRLGKYGLYAAWAGWTWVGIHAVLTKDKETKTDNSDIESEYTVPNPFTEGESENQQFDTGKEEKKSASQESADNVETNKQVSNWELPESERETVPQSASEKYLPNTDTTTTTTSTPAASSKKEIGGIYTKRWEVRKVFLINGTLQAQKKDWTFETLISDVTDSNLRHKFTMIANTPFND